MTSSYDRAVKLDLEAVASAERAVPKLTNVQVGYTEELTQGHRCDECWMWIRPPEPLQEGESDPVEVGRCGQVSGKIKGFASCNFFLRGIPQAEGHARENPVKLGQIEAGYVERRDGVRCATCSRYSPPVDAGDGTPGACEVKYGATRFWACCNEWSDGKPWVLIQESMKASNSRPGYRNRWGRKVEAVIGAAQHELAQALRKAVHEAIGTSPGLKPTKSQIAEVGKRFSTMAESILKKRGAQAYQIGIVKGRDTRTALHESMTREANNQESASWDERRRQRIQGVTESMDDWGDDDDNADADQGEFTNQWVKRAAAMGLGLWTLYQRGFLTSVGRGGAGGVVGGKSGDGGAGGGGDGGKEPGVAGGVAGGIAGGVGGVGGREPGRGAGGAGGAGGDDGRGYPNRYVGKEPGVSADDGTGEPESVLLGYQSVGDDATCEPCSEADDASPYTPDDCPVPGEICDGGDNCRCEIVPWG